MSLTFSGGITYSINADKIKIHIQQIANIRVLGDSLRLRLRLISSDVKILPGTTLKGSNYDIIALFDLQPIKKSQVLKDIIKQTTMINTITRKQLILILEQQTNYQKYKLIHWKYLNNNALNLSFSRKQNVKCRSLKKPDLYQRLSTPTKILYRKQCQVCMIRDKHKVKGVCNHLCEQCQQTLTQCPICRLQIMKHDKKTILQILRRFKRKSISKQNPQDQFKLSSSYDSKMNKNMSYLRKCTSISQLCPICCENPKNYVNINCKHMCSCYQCGSKVSVCPICRTKMKGIKVFL